MFCSNCGAELPDGSKFCPNCGSKIVPASRVNNESSFEDTVDGLGSKIGEGIDSAASEISGDLHSAGQEFTKSMEDAGQMASEYAEKVSKAAKNWRDYVTLENAEKLAALGLSLPLFMVLVNFATSFVANAFSFVPIFGVVIRIVPALVRILFVVASFGALASIIYLILNDGRRNTWAYIALGGNILAFAVCIGNMARWWKPSLGIIFGLIFMLLGIDEISRVIIQKKSIESEPNVSEDIEALENAYADYKAAHPSGPEVEKARIASDPKASYFDGDGITLLGLYILTILVTMVTCGIAAPWMICKVLRWRKEHTVIGGRRLSFNGTGGSLFGHWILWSLLTVVTCGIFSFFQAVCLMKWEAKHTAYADRSSTYGEYVDSVFDGNSFEYFGYGLLQVLLLTLTCGLAFPWTVTMIQRWKARHTIVNGDRMYYDGSSLGILGQYIIIYLLTLITFGIYAPWGTVRMNKYIYGHTHVDNGYKKIEG